MKKSIIFLLVICLVSSLFLIPVSATETVAIVNSSQSIDYAFDGIVEELDTDNDGIEDIIEIVYGFDAHNPDTDGDGVDDFVEFCVTHTEVLLADGDIDTDKDGLSNAEEAIWGTHPADADIDGDGLLDGDEVYLYATDPLNPDIDGDGLKDGAEFELGLNPLNPMTDGNTADGKNPVAVAYLNAFGLNVVETENSPIFDLLAVGDDSDYDGRINSNDASPNTNGFSGKLYTDYTTSNVTYNMDYRWFFSSNSTYNPDLAVVSSLLSSNVYATNHINITAGGTLTTTNSNSMTNWMSFHGMSDIKNYSLSNSDNHVSQMYVGHREVTYGSSTKNIVCVVIRGTNGTLKEWSSNFDLGSTATSHSQWTNSSNHKGFDITANRLNSNLNTYLSTYCSDTTNVLWITGHSRGGALANILAAKQVDAGKTVFAYTFASPNTTTASTAITASKYKCIFNLINSDDFVVYLPMTDWGFRRYGVTRYASIADSFEVKWETLTGIFDYNPDTIGLQDTVDSLAATSTSRNNCYTYPSGASAYYEKWYATESARNTNRSNIIDSYTSNTSGTYKYTNHSVGTSQFGFRMYHQPAFLMQTLAGVMAGEMTKTEFALLNVVPYLEDAKANIIASAISGIKHPHYTESYYLLARELP